MVHYGWFQDYRNLDQVIIKDKTPLLLIGEVIDKLKKAKYFNKLNLIWGYNNVQIKEGNKWKAACYDRHLRDAAWTWVKGMTTMIGCAEVVSVSTSWSRCCRLTYSLLSPYVMILMYTLWTTHRLL